MEHDNTVIRVKDLQIFEDAISKNKTALSTYEAMMAGKQGETVSYPLDTNFHRSSEQFLDVELLPSRRKRSCSRKSVSHSPDTNLF